MRPRQEAGHQGFPMDCLDYDVHADSALLMIVTDRSCSRQEWFDGVLKAATNNDSVAPTA